MGALLATIPDPLVGGVLASSMAMVGGVAVANLQQVHMLLDDERGETVGSEGKIEEGKREIENSNIEMRGILK